MHLVQQIKLESQLNQKTCSSMKFNQKRIIINTICGLEAPAAGFDEVVAAGCDDASLVEGMPSREAVLEFIALTSARLFPCPCEFFGPAAELALSRPDCIVNEEEKQPDGQNVVFHESTYIEIISQKNLNTF